MKGLRNQSMYVIKNFTAETSFQSEEGRQKEGNIVYNFFYGIFCLFLFSVFTRRLLSHKINVTFPVKMFFVSSSLSLPVPLVKISSGIFIPKKMYQTLFSSIPPK